MVSQIEDLSLAPVGLIVGLTTRTVLYIIIGGAQDEKIDNYGIRTDSLVWRGGTPATTIQ